MTLLSSSLSTAHRAQAAEYRHYAYLNNGWNKLQRWDGIKATLDQAGIDGPSRVEDSWTPTATEASGDCTVGVHFVRYRYMESKTGYVSNPSTEREVEVASAKGKLTFTIEATEGAGSDATKIQITTTTDTKIDRLILEMTTVGDAFTFYKAAEYDIVAAAAGTAVVIDVSDAVLEQKGLPWPDLGHDPPPVARNVLSHRSRIWLFSQVVHTTGTATFTNATKTVVGASHLWLTSALGTSATDRADAPWFIRKSGDARSYEISYFDATNTLHLVEAYAGSTTAGASYQIFSRADVVWVSNPGFPEGFTPLKWIDAPNGERASEITAGIGYGASVLFFSKFTMVRLSWDQGPLVDPIYVPVSSVYGALNQRCVIELDGTVYALSTRGVASWRGVSPSLISQPLGAYLDSVDWSKADKFHCAYHPKIEAIRWFVCYTGETYPKHYWQFDIRTKTWSTGEYLQGISESRLVPWTNGTLEVIYGDENGHTWIADKGYADGCDEDYSHPTVGAGSTVSNVVFTTTLPTYNAGLTGCYLYWPEHDEYRLISANTAGLISLSSPFSNAPAQGDTLWVGAFPSKLKTKAFSSKHLGKVKQSGYLWIQFLPSTSSRRLRLRTYEDLSTTAKTWAASRNDLPGSEWPGSNSDYPAADWILLTSDSDGNIEVPIGSEWRRYVEIEFEGWEPDSDWELGGFEHDGLEIQDP